MSRKKCCNCASEFFLNHSRFSNNYNFPVNARYKSFSCLNCVDFYFVYHNGYLITAVELRRENSTQLLYYILRNRQLR